MPCEITIVAPDVAEEGATVSVTATVRNPSSFHSSYATWIYADTTLLLSQDEIIKSGSSVSYSTSFSMPGADVVILVYVERWDGTVGAWLYDNSASKVVALAAALPEFAGAISRKELKYDMVTRPIPVT